MNENLNLDKICIIEENIEWNKYGVGDTTRSLENPKIKTILLKLLYFCDWTISLRTYFSKPMKFENIAYQ